MISSTDFNNWMSDPVTVAFMNVVVKRIHDASEYLSNTAGADSVSDNYWRGFIAGQREVLEVTFENEA